MDAPASAALPSESVMHRLARLYFVAPCPCCAAPVDEPCRGVRGQPVRYTHFQRRHAARRARNLSRLEATK